MITRWKNVLRFIHAIYSSVRTPRKGCRRGRHIRVSSFLLLGLPWRIHWNVYLRKVNNGCFTFSLGTGLQICKYCLQKPQLRIEYSWLIYQQKSNFWSMYRLDSVALLVSSNTFTNLASNFEILRYFFSRLIQLLVCSTMVTRFILTRKHFRAPDPSREELFLQA